MTTILKTPSTWPAIILRPNGAPDPTGLDAAVQDGAFAGFRRAVRDLGSAGTIATVAASGLRGRGGGGRETAVKWRAAAETEAPRRYVVAHGYGADPASSTDRQLLADRPFRVLEGLLIAAWAVAAEEAIIAVRAEDGETILRLGEAIAEAEAANLAGLDVLGTGRDILVRVQPIQGAYMLGEETVLLKALEGRRGQPDQRPPHPATHGLFGMPTVVQNVQTLAAVPWILVNGPEAFTRVGDPAAPGTILVQVRGPERTGIAEVPTGTTLREIVALGGRPGRGHAVKAVLVGGPSGGILPPTLLDTPYTFEALRAAGAHVGSGSVVVADERACIVDLARVLVRYCADEACGKTIPCRIGLRRLSEIGDRMTAGTSRAGDLDLLGDLAADISASALCDHERLATLPLLSGMRYFQDELDAHVERSTCPAGVCHPIAMAAGAASAQ
jgi:NADH-quinone oxidoreductase subunit F